MAELVAYQVPAIIGIFLLSRWFIPHARVPLLSSAIMFYLSARIFPTVLISLIKPFGVPFKVTPKGKTSRDKGSDPLAIWCLVVLIVLTVGGIIVGCRSSANLRSPEGLLICAVWGLCNLVLFMLTLLSVAQQPRLRGEERFPIDRPGSLKASGRTQSCSIIDMSQSGALLGGVSDLGMGELVQLSLNDVGILSGTVVRKIGNRIGICFADIPTTVRDSLIVYLYTSGFCNCVEEVSSSRVLWRLLRKAIFGMT
jgi:cellulose synthase (UDP-forming)